MELPVVMNLCLISILIGLLLPLPAILQAQNLETSYYQNQFGPFNGSYYTSFAVLAPSTIGNGALQVTPDSAGNFNLTHRSGRVMFNQSFKLWQEEEEGNQGGGGGGGGKAASFNSSFLINIFRIDNSSVIGEGLAFLIAPDLDLPLNSDGGFLGLTNSTADGNSSNGIVAIEFDTFKQSYDPDDNHIGLDIHSVISNKTVPLSDFGIQIAPMGITYYVVWVHYNGVNKSLEVFMAEQGKAKPSVPLLTSELDLKGLVNQYSYFGFAASTGSSIQLNCVYSWNLTVELLPSTIGHNANNNKAIKIFLRFGLPGLAALLLLLIGAGCLLYYQRKKRKKPVINTKLRKALKSLPNPRAFPFKDLKKATNNFDAKHKIGEGSVAVVYRGVLHSENLQVAIKLFRDKATMGPEYFLSELNIISRLRHRHLLPLLGWCYKNGKLLLVYDLMPNGSLDKYTFNEPAERNALGWNARYKIMSEVASALYYLHFEIDQKVVHGDIKPSNIMLDSGFTAHLGDFGLARILFDDRTSLSGETIRGTVGYLAPEVLHTGRVSCESDVYAFGVVVLEVVCGQRTMAKIADFPSLGDWVWRLYREGRILEAVDGKLGNHYAVEEAERLLLLGLACSHPNPNARPKTRDILQIISGSMSVPEVPPFKPAFVWPATTSGAALSSGSISSGTISLTGNLEIVADDPVFQVGTGSDGGTMSFEITARE